MNAALNRVHRWWKRWRCPHKDTTNRITVSGYGYTEYQIWWCCDCGQHFILQTQEQR